MAGKDVQPGKVEVQSYTRQAPTKITARPTKVTIKDTVTRTTTYDYGKRK